LKLCSCGRSFVVPIETVTVPPDNVTLIGLLYGITAASTLAFYIEFLSVVVINVFLAI
jgi:hypothetical protein